MERKTKITLLGTGTSVGIPSLGQLGWGKCNPKNPKNKRQRCVVLIQSNKTNILIDAGPDIKNQLINLSKIVKNEWDKIDKQIPDLEQEKLEFVSTFPDELKELYDNLKKRGLEVIAAYRNDNQCGCCGVELTSNEIEQILESKFQQCSYCDGVVI